MDFQFTEEQQALRRQVREFLERECPKSLVRELEASPTGHSPDLWRKMAEVGWLGITVPERYGGAGGSFLNQMVLVEEMGRNILPGPYFSSVVLSGHLLLTAGDEEQRQRYLNKLVKGELIISCALQEAQRAYDPDAIDTQAKKQNGVFTLSGTKMFIPYAHIADTLLCLARTATGSTPQQGLTLFLVDTKTPGVQCTVLDTVGDGKQCEVILDKVPAAGVLGQVNQAWSHLQDTLRRATALKCAEMVGGVQKVLEMATDYAKQRVQFGRPIGSFQAIQHYLADMAVDVDRSRFITYLACWNIDQGRPADIEVSAAKAFVSDAYQRVAWLAHLIFASISYYKEHDLQLYYRRAKEQELELGDAQYHRELIAQRLGI